MYNFKVGKCTLQVHAKTLDQTAERQINDILSHPALEGLVAIMPDAHAGSSCVIGFTGKFNRAVIPNIVGVDIGCGVVTYPLQGIDRLDFPALDRYVRETVPMGMN